MQATPLVESTSTVSLSSEPPTKTDAASPSSSTSASSSPPPTASTSATDEAAWSVAAPMSADEEAIYAERVKVQLAGEVVKPFWVSNTSAVRTLSCNDYHIQKSKSLIKNQDYNFN